MISSGRIDSTCSDSVEQATNFWLLLPYFAPYVLYVGLGYLGEFLTLEWIYALRLLMVIATLVWAYRWFRPVVGSKSPVASTLIGIVAGIGATLVWLVLLSPFVHSGAVVWSRDAFLLRLTAASFVVPFAEELVMRGYIFFFVVQWYALRKSGEKGAFDKTLYNCNVNQQVDVFWHTPAVLISSLVFMAGHHMVEWPAAFVYGLIMAGLLIYRKDLITCIVAHGTTNFCLGIYVYTTGHWEFW